MAAKSGAIKAGGAFVEIFADDSKLVRGLRKAQRRLKAFASFATGAGRRMATSATAMAAPFAIALTAFAKIGDTFDKISQRTGVSVEMLSKLGFAAEQSGADVETLEKGLAAMGRFMVDATLGSKEATDALNFMGLSMADLESKTPDERIKLLLQQLAKIEDPSIRAGVAMKVLGRAGRQLLPMAGNFEKLSAEAERFGLVMSTEDAAKAAQLTDTMNLLKSVLKRVMFTIGSALAPAMIKMSKIMSKMSNKFMNFLKVNKRMIVLIVSAIAVLFAAGGALMAAGLAASALSAIIGLATTVWTGFGAAISFVIANMAVLASWPVLIGAALLALAAVFIDWGGVVDRVGSVFGGLRDRALEAFGGIRDAIATGDIGLAFKIVTLLMRSEWIRFVNVLKKGWMSFTGFFVSIWTDAVFGIAKIFTRAFSGLKKFWIGFTSFIETNWNTTVGFIAKAWEGLKELVTGERGRSAEDIDRETREKNKAVEDEKQSELGAIEDRKKGALSELEKEQTQRHAAREKEMQDALKANEDRLANARKELKSAVDGAAEKRRQEERKEKALRDAKFDDIDVGDGGALGAKASVEGARTGFERFGDFEPPGREEKKLLGKIEENTRPPIAVSIKIPNF